MECSVNMLNKLQKHVPELILHKKKVPYTIDRLHTITECSRL